MIKIAVALLAVVAVVLIVRLVLAWTRGRRIAVDATLFDGSHAATAVRGHLERLAALAPAYSGYEITAGQPVADTLAGIVEETQELLRRLRQRGTPQQVLVAQTEYASTLGHVVTLVDPEHLKDILDNPHRWHHPDQRVADIGVALDAVHDQIVENIRQASARSDLSFQVALASLSTVAQQDELTTLYGETL